MGGWRSQGGRCSLRTRFLTGVPGQGTVGWRGDEHLWRCGKVRQQRLSTVRRKAAEGLTDTGPPALRQDSLEMRACQIHFLSKLHSWGPYWTHAVDCRGLVEIYY